MPGPTPALAPTDAELNSVLTIAMHAAFADGAKDERERARLREIAAKIGGDRIDLDALDRRAPDGSLHLAGIVAPLSTPAIRRYAYEVAVSVAAADGAHGDAEAAFLRRSPRPWDCLRSTRRSSSPMPTPSPRP